MTPERRAAEYSTRTMKRYETALNSHAAEMVEADTPMAALAYLIEPFAHASDGRPRAVLARLQSYQGSVRGMVYVEGDPPLEVAVWEHREAVAA